MGLGEGEGGSKRGLSFSRKSSSWVSKSVSSSPVSSPILPHRGSGFWQGMDPDQFNFVGGGPPPPLSLDEKATASSSSSTSKSFLAGGGGDDPQDRRSLSYRSYESSADDGMLPVVGRKKSAETTTTTTTMASDVFLAQDAASSAVLNNICGSAERNSMFSRTGRGGLSNTLGPGGGVVVVSSHAPSSDDVQHHVAEDGYFPESTARDDGSGQDTKRREKTGTFLLSLLPSRSLGPSPFVTRTHNTLTHTRTLLSLHLSARSWQYEFRLGCRRKYAGPRGAWPKRAGPKRAAEGTRC